jgi:hypothetical protein
MTRRVLSLTIGVSVLAACSSGQQGSQAPVALIPTAAQLSTISPHSAGCDTPEQITLQRKGGTVFYPACAPWKSMQVPYLAYESPPKGTVTVTIEDGENNYDDVPAPVFGGTRLYYFSVCCASQTVQLGDQKELDATLPGPQFTPLRNANHYWIVSYVNGYMDGGSPIDQVHCKKTGCKLSFESPYVGVSLEPTSRLDFLIVVNPTGS